MVRILKLWIALLLGGPFSSAVSSGGSVANLEDVSLAALEARLTEIESELKQLARVSLRSGIGAIGYRSASYGEARSSEWVEVALDRAYPIDEIVLVPTLSRNSKEGFHSDGFPSAFRVVAGMGREDEGTVIATYDVSDQLLPRIAPVTIPIGGIVAEWVRVEATQLSSRAFKGRYIFQLSEMMVFSGVRNVALRQPVTASSVHRRDLVHAWDLSFLVDGYAIPFRRHILVTWGFRRIWWLKALCAKTFLTPFFCWRLFLKVSPTQRL